MCTSPSRLLSRSSGGTSPTSIAGHRRARLSTAALSFSLRASSRDLTGAHACPQPPAAVGPVFSEDRPLASFGRGMKIQGPQCAFEPSMFMCPAVHMSTRNMLRSTSTYETSGRILSDVSSLLHHHHHRTGPIHFHRCSVGLPPLGRTRQHAARDTQGIASSF